MAGSMTGDWAALEREMGRLVSAERRGIGDATRAAREGVEDQYRADFAGSRDPFGRAWAPTQRGNTPLIGPTLALANPEISHDSTAGGGVVRVKPVKYWVFHQGGIGVPEREILPYGPSKWDAPIQRRIGDVIEGSLR